MKFPLCSANGCTEVLREGVFCQRHLPKTKKDRIVRKYPAWRRR